MATDKPKQPWRSITIRLNPKEYASLMARVAKLSKGFAKTNPTALVKSEWLEGIKT